MKCIKCGTEHIEKFCPECGTPSKRRCPSCGGETEGKFCTLCGTALPDIQQTIQPQSAAPQAPIPPQIIINNTNTNTVPVVMGRKMCNKWVAFLLYFFLGFLGGHKFYEGKAIIGILYMFTFGLFGIGWLVDCIIILCKPDPYYV